jgi:hypothetical protein
MAELKPELLCSGEEFKKIIKSKFRASNTLLKSAQYAITKKEHFSFLY